MTKRILLKNTSRSQQYAPAPSFRDMRGSWEPGGGVHFRTSEELLAERLLNPYTAEILVQWMLPDRLLLESHHLEPVFGNMVRSPFNQVVRFRDPLSMNSLIRGVMNREATITPAGVSAFENTGEINGSFAVKVNVNEGGLIKLDLRIVDDAGSTLAEWPGVDVLGGSQITWCFSDTGNIRISMTPTVE